ncbi:hypothetical protein CP532_7012 [Ophiocordyceps camponoti-leonardi (nom. inval.)]|nr:hypothetical protein CP532_7012 [Ophiocordyceps camponoti-leonardi (nom. inval.)]
MVSWERDFKMEEVWYVCGVCGLEHDDAQHRSTYRCYVDHFNDDDDDDDDDDVHNNHNDDGDDDDENSNNDE